jgi:sulfate permease, SulP family
MTTQQGPRPAAAPLQGLLPIARAGLWRDLLAGITLAALAIPEVMGYTRIAGTPVVTGLYTLLLPAALFALFGSSRHLVVGADSATAAILAASLAPLARPASAEWMALAGVLALMSAALLLLARLARLAFLADFLSRTVLAGFLTGVGVQVALGELPVLLGLKVEGSGTFGQLLGTLANLHALHWADAAIGCGVVLSILAARRWAPRWPMPLFAVLAALAASWGFGLDRHGLAVVGPLQGGLPAPALPSLAHVWDRIDQLAPAAVAMAVVILAQSAATSRAYAWKYGERFSENRDLVGLGLANAGAALTGTFVVNGSPTKTQMVDSAGGRSQFAHLTMVAVVVLVLLFLTAPIAHLPDAALAGVVFVIGIELVQVRELRAIHRVRRSEFWVALATAAAVVAVGVQQAIMLAMLLSLIDHVRRGYRPHNSVLARGEDGHARPVPLASGQQYAPGLLVYRFSHSMYYANVEVMVLEVDALVGAAAPPLRWLVMDLDAVDDVDFSAGAALREMQASLAARQVVLKFLRPSPAVLQQLGLHGLAREDGLGTGHFSSVRQMRHAFAREFGEPPATADAAPPATAA